MLIERNSVKSHEALLHKATGCTLDQRLRRHLVVGELPRPHLGVVGYEIHLTEDIIGIVTMREASIDYCIVREEQPQANHYQLQELVNMNIVMIRMFVPTNDCGWRRRASRATRMVTSPLLCRVGIGNVDQ